MGHYVLLANAMTIVGILGTVSALLAACWSAVSLYRKLRAERKLVQAIQVKLRKEECVQKCKELKKGKLSQEDFAELEKEIGQVSKGLPVSIQHQVSRGLNQPSQEGRAEYIEKLVGQAKLFGRV